jgi:hypothetical protein
MTTGHSSSRIITRNLATSALHPTSLPVRSNATSGGEDVAALHAEALRNLVSQEAVVESIDVDGFTYNQLARLESCAPSDQQRTTSLQQDVMRLELGVFENSHASQG